LAPRFPPRLALLVSILAVSSASILIRWAQAPPLAVASWRMVLSSLMVLPFFLVGGGVDELRRAGVGVVVRLVVIGVVLAVHFASWITSLSLTTVASSVLFVHVDPLLVALVSHFWLGERLGARGFAGVVLGFLGASLIAWGDVAPGGGSLVGDLLALLGGVMLGLYILGGRVARRNLTLVAYVFPVYLTAAVVLLGLSWVMGVGLVGYPPRTMGLFALIALIPMIFGHTVYNWALRYVSAPLVSVSLLGEPVGASILAYLVLGEEPGLHVLVGGAVTLAGILLTVWPES